MNSSIIRSSFIVILLGVIFLAGCDKSPKIKIVDQADDSYYKSNQITKYAYIETSVWSKEKLEESRKLMSKLFTLSDRGRKDFNYTLYINKKGQVDKAQIVKGLDPEFDIQFLNFEAQRNRNIAEINGDTVKYQITIDNTVFYYPKRDFKSEKKVAEIKQKDNSYPYLEEVAANLSQKGENYKAKFYGYLKYGFIDLVNKRISTRYKTLGGFNENYINENKYGNETAYYEIYVDENGKIPKVRVISGFGKAMDELIISDLPSVTIFKKNEFNKPETFKFLWRLTRARVYKNVFTDYFSEIIPYQVSDKTIQKVLSDKGNSSINKEDYIDLELTDEQDLLLFPRFYIEADTKNEAAKEIIVKYYQDIEDSNPERVAFRLAYNVYIAEDGSVDFVEPNERKENSIDKFLMPDLSRRIYEVKYDNKKPTKYKALVILHSLLSDKTTFVFTGMVHDERFPQDIFEKPDGLEEQDFVILPDVSAKPVGGYWAISQKVKYPKSAIKLRKEGEISVKAYIDANGKVIGVQVMKSLGFGFESAAVEAIKKSQFQPAYLNGKPVPSICVIPFIFQLDSNSVIIDRENIEGELNDYRQQNKQNEKHDAKIDDDVYFVAVEEMPGPVGGMKAVQDKIRYPEIAKRAGIEGRVFVKAYIDENGDVKKTVLIKGIGAGCDEAAMRAVEQTKFTPGKQRGKTVKVQVSVPILFKLSDSPEPKKDAENKWLKDNKK